MKKIYLMFAAFVACLFAVAESIKIDTDYNMPELDKENAFVLDVQEFKGRKIQSLRVVNYSDNQGLAFDAYVHSPLTEKWEFLGSAVLKGFGNRAEVGKDYESISKFRYFAVVPQNKDGFDFTIEKNKKNLFSKAVLTIEARSPEYAMEEDPKPSFSEVNAYVSTESEIPEKAKKDIAIINRTDKRELSVKVYGYSKKTVKWVPLGTVNTKVTEAQSYLKMKKSKIQDYYYFAFSGPAEILYSFEADHGDLVVTVRDK